MQCLYPQGTRSRPMRQRVPLASHARGATGLPSQLTGPRHRWRPRLNSTRLSLAKMRLATFGSPEQHAHAAPVWRQGARTCRSSPLRTAAALVSPRCRAAALRLSRPFSTACSAVSGGVSASAAAAAAAPPALEVVPSVESPLGPSPLGADTVNFALWSRNAKSITLCLCVPFGTGGLDRARQSQSAPLTTSLSCSLTPGSETGSRQSRRGCTPCSAAATPGTRR